MRLLDVIPSHLLATKALELIKRLMATLHIPDREVVSEIIYTLLVLAIAWGIGWLIKRVIVWLSRLLVKHHDTDMTREMIKERLMMRCGHIIPPLVMLALLPMAFKSGVTVIRVVEKLLWVYTMVMIAVAICAVLTLIWTRFNARQNTRNLPLKGILNTAKGVVWAIFAITAFSFLLDRSPAYLLTGLGAFAAALMLIFKDTILGLVAGIQLSQNDMLRVGDWIVVPNTPANGTVLDMSLTAVKVLNWDNTTVTLPPYSLVSGSFQNYRSMTQGGARRIARLVVFDNLSVHALSPDETAKIASRLPLLADYVKKTPPGLTYSADQATVNGTVDTNLGLFRAYMCRYILSRDEFDHNTYMMVRIMDHDANGIPVQIYCFTATSNWVAYEAIQSALIEHVAAVAPIFGLQLYNAPSGSDIDEVHVIRTEPDSQSA